jgi:hypothetical protein
MHHHGLIEPLESRRLLSEGAPYIASTPVLPGAPSVVGVKVRAITGRRIASQVIDVTYRDDIAIDPTSLDNRDLRVTRADGSLVGYARLSSSTISDDGRTRVVRYKLSPPGGFWNRADNGAYRIQLRGGPQGVADTNGTFIEQQTLARFRVAI